MKIALDFDGTFTAAPALWITFIDLARRFGHEVRIVTMRCAIKDGINWAHAGCLLPPAEVIWCDGQPKRDYCRTVAKWEPDIWIDDDPYALIHGSKWTGNQPELVKWRETDVYHAPAERPLQAPQGAAVAPKLQRARRVAD